MIKYSDPVLSASISQRFVCHNKVIFGTSTLLYFRLLYRLLAAEKNSWTDFQPVAYWLVTLVPNEVKTKWFGKNIPCSTYCPERILLSESTSRHNKSLCRTRCLFALSSEAASEGTQVRPPAELCLLSVYACARGILRACGITRFKPLCVNRRPLWPEELFTHRIKEIKTDSVKPANCTISVD